MAIASKRFDITDGEVKLPVANFYDISTNDVFNFSFSLNDINFNDSAFNSLNSMLGNANNALNTLQSGISSGLNSVNAQISGLVGQFTSEVSNVASLDASFTDVLDTVTPWTNPFANMGNSWIETANRLTRTTFDSSLLPATNTAVLDYVSKQAYSANDFNQNYVANLLKDSNTSSVPIASRVSNSLNTLAGNNFANLVNEVTKTSSTTINNLVDKKSSPAAVASMAVTLTVNGYKSKTYGLFDKLTTTITDKPFLYSYANDVLMNCVSQGLVYGIIDICNCSVGDKIRLYNPGAIKMVLASIKAPSDLKSSDYKRFVDTLLVSIVKLEPTWTLANNKYQLSNDFTKLLQLTKYQTQAIGLLSDASFAAVAAGF